MTTFAHTTPAPKPRTNSIVSVSLLLAGIFILMAIGQLFSFEKFLPLIESFGVTGSHGMSTLITCLIVISEVMAVPFLLRMHLSPLMRYVSMGMAKLAALLWLYITIAVNVSVNGISNIGFLGTKVHLPVGWWAVGVSLGLVVLAAWSIWGLWPRAARKAPSKK